MPVPVPVPVPAFVTLSAKVVTVLLKVAVTARAASFSGAYQLAALITAIAAADALFLPKPDQG